MTASYPGASAEVVSDTVSTPLEQEINGVEGMLYMVSQATADGQLSLTVTFALGTDLDIAQVLVQNRVAIAEPRLPEEVRQIGVTVRKNSPDMLMVIHLSSPDGSRDQLYISNYATLQIRDVLARLDGVGDVRVFGARNYSMRIWLDPDKVAARNLTAGDVVQALRGQNVQVASGVLNQPPVPDQGAFQLNVETLGRLKEAKEFENIVVKTEPGGRVTRLRDIARVELGAQDYTANGYLDRRPAVPLLIFQQPGSNALATADRLLATMAELAQSFPSGLRYDVIYNPTEFIAAVGPGGDRHDLRGDDPGRPRGDPVPADLARLDHPDRRHPDLADRHFRGHGGVRLLAQQPVPVRPGAGDRHRGRRRDRGGRERGTQPRAGHEPEGRGAPHDRRGRQRPGRDRAGARGGVHSGRLHQRHLGPVLPAVRDHHRSGHRRSPCIVSLTLSPALCALLLKPPQAETRSRPLLLRPVHGFFAGFNWLFDRLARGYGGVTRRLVRLTAVVLVVYAGLIALTGWQFERAPTGFIPQQDLGYLITVIQLPPGASLARTDAGRAARRGDHSGHRGRRRHGVPFAGFDGATFTNAPNAGAIFSPLAPFEERAASGRSANVILADLNAKLSTIQEAFIVVVTPPPVRGIGTAGGFKMMVQDRRGRGLRGARGGDPGAGRRRQPDARACSTCSRCSTPARPRSTPTSTG